MGIDMASIAITVVYSPRAREVVELPLVVEVGCTAVQALQVCGVLAQVMTDAQHPAGLGVWGRRVTPDYVLHDNDRLEICRALTVDPKVARRERFAGQGAKKAAGLFAKRRAGAKAGY